MQTIDIIKPNQFIRYSGCELCNIKLLKSYKSHIDSVKHAKNYKHYLQVMDRLAKGLSIRDYLCHPQSSYSTTTTLIF